jgi:excisionase family DNA binding protein
MTAPLTVLEVAEQLKCDKRFVLKELATKRLRGSKLNIGWRITQADLDTYIDAHANVSKVRVS